MKMEGAAAEEGDAAGITPPAAPTCPVCMEPWTCTGDHRICCIPCGHVYGRSCLERWLHRSADDSAKCPQCGDQFEYKLITNLYAPGSLWDGCCRLQEFKSGILSSITDMEEELSSAKETMAAVRHETDRLRAHVMEEAADKRAELKEQRAKMRAKLKKRNAKARARMNASMALMKEQMRKMAEEESATAADLIEFVERSFPQRSPFSVNQHAPVDSQKNKMQLGNRPGRPPPVQAPPDGPADAVKKRPRQRDLM